MRLIGQPVYIKIYHCGWEHDREPYGSFRKRMYTNRPCSRAADAIDRMCHVRIQILTAASYICRLLASRSRN